MIQGLDTDRAARIARRSLGSMFFLIGALNASWVARIPAIRDHLALGDRALGLLLLSPAAGAMIAFRVAGGLTARHGSRRVARASVSVFCVLVVLPAVAPGPLWAALAFVLAGMASGMLDIAINAHGVELEHRLGRPILGSLHGLVCLGRFAGAGGAALAAAAGLSPGVHLVIAGLGFQALAQLAGPGLLQPRVTSAPVHTSAPPAMALGPRHLGALVALGAVCFCSSASEGAMADWSGVYLRDTLRASEAIAASGYAAFSLAMLAGRFAGDALTTQLGAAGLVRGGGVVIALALGTGLAINTAPAMITALAATGLGVAMLVPTAFRASTRLPGISQGAAIATLATVSYAAFFAGPPAIGLLSASFTLRAALVLVAALGLVLMVLAPVVASKET